MVAPANRSVFAPEEAVGDSEPAKTPIGSAAISAAHYLGKWPPPNVVDGIEAPVAAGSWPRANRVESKLRTPQVPSSRAGSGWHALVAVERPKQLTTTPLLLHAFAQLHPHRAHGFPPFVAVGADLFPHSNATFTSVPPYAGNRNLVLGAPMEEVYLFSR
jgi:hypothetical protein